MSRYQQLWNRFWKDKNGRVVIWQNPDPLLWTWIIGKLLLLLIRTGIIATSIIYLSSALLLVWAYFELTQGVNYFRRLLGLVVLIGVAISYLRH